MSNIQTQQNKSDPHIQSHPFNPTPLSFPIPSYPQRSSSHSNPSSFWQPILNINMPSTQNQPLSKHQNLSSPSLNVHQLNQDLLKLKEQLKKLAEKGEEIGANKARAEQAYSARIRLESTHQVPQIKTNLNNQSTQHKRKEGSELIYYPSTTSHPNSNQIINKFQENQKGGNQNAIQRREKIDSFLQNREEKGKIIPFINPNKRQFQRINNDHQQLQKNRTENKSQTQIKELKQKIIKLQQELQQSNQQKQSLTQQIKTLTQNNEQLRGIMRKQKEIRSKSMIIDPTIPFQQEKEQKRSSFMIEKLQNELSQLKNNNRVSFDEALKSQLEENKLLKIRIDEKNEEIQNIKDLLQNQRKINESLKNQLTLQEMKSSTELRVKQRKLQIQISDKSNQLQTTRRALQTLDLKYRTSIQEIKEKDNFIMNYLVGRSRQTEREEIRSLLEKYMISFPENRTMEDLLREQREIQSLRMEIKRLKNQ